jgi:hypothetical protein
MFFEVYYSQPDISAVRFDPGDAFRFPFTVSNNHFLTLHRVNAGCRLSASLVGYPGKDKKPQISDFEFFKGDVRDLPYGTTQDCFCESRLSPLAELKTTILVYYQIHLIPFWPWRRKREKTFNMLIDSQGTPFWVEGD